MDDTESSLQLSYSNYRSKIQDATLRRFFASIECARVYNTKYLLENANLNLKGQYGRLALTIVCYISAQNVNSQLTILSWLLKENCDFNLEDNEGMTLLAFACKLNKFHVCKHLIDHYKMEIDFSKSDKNGDTVLMHAIRANNLKLVQVVVDAMKALHVDMNVVNLNGMTAFLIAQELNYVKIADFLIEEANVSTTIQSFPMERRDKISSRTKFKAAVQQSCPSEHVTDNEKVRRQMRCVSASGFRRRQPVISGNDFRETNVQSKSNNSKKSVETENLYTVKKRKPKKKKTTQSQNKAMSSHRNSFSHEHYEQQLSVTRRSVGTENNDAENNVRCTSYIIEPDTPNADDEENGSEIENKFECNIKHRHSSDQLKESTKHPSLLNKRHSLFRRNEISINPSPESQLIEKMAKYKFRLEELMEYKPNVRENSMMTYTDLKTMLPSQKITGKSSSFQSLSWMLQLKAEETISRSRPAFDIATNGNACSLENNSLKTKKAKPFAQTLFDRILRSSNVS